MNHQDWKVLSWDKMTKQTKQSKPNLSDRQIKEIKINQITEAESIKKYTIQNQRNLMDLRRDRKLTQKDLAHRCNLNIHQIQEIENRSGIYNASIIQKINNIFKINLNKDI